ncbi:amino acid/amide ABC transporter substrate-binding protein (HAAT family) [Plasticicumulans lactativorans]|uniref:Amino acid/amide ABC transporter substrate-binding protein (HAAT family) n=1 Tax=Plasticicumulans lactativorans TaxID=1133106 RepID=A0A4R2L4Y0_9GAMM|nr:ABC transporter substrate-binding protein [Plasticicumulans lactativorans]TCO80832.1 amino acid/amide ABC transporter substrate-binding protein (HAAT family) [Plasticicumulans lactativorans]
MHKHAVLHPLALALLAAAAAPALADDIVVGHLAAYTGPTSDVGRPYGQGVADALNYLNQKGGINGRRIAFQTVDYGYNAPQAIATYKKWMSADAKPVAVQGWGTADTEALAQFAATDKVFFMSASYSGHLTDPQGKSQYVKAPAPYNFFYGPSYTDGCRGVVQWAAEDWKRKGGKGAPKFVHMGDNHPYPNAPKEGCAAYAKELGFEVLNPIVYSLKPGDFKAQCLSLKESGAHYAYLANTSGSNISLLQSCRTVGVDTQFLSNVWGWDEYAEAAAAGAGRSIVWVVGAAGWKDDVPGMAVVREVSKVSDAAGSEVRPLHYMRAVCGVFLMRDAMLAADRMAGGITGTNIKAAMEQFRDHRPEELGDVCLKSTWTAEDHRGTNQVLVYQSTDKGFEKIYTATLERRPDWLGW